MKLKYLLFLILQDLNKLRFYVTKRRGLKKFQFDHAPNWILNPPVLYKSL